MANAGDNLIQTFMLEKSGLRGRCVRLGGVLNDILVPHDYPEALGRLTAEAAALAALLASMLKYDGVFTLQAQGDGPVAMVIADMTSDGALRACATIREGRSGEITELDNPALALTLGGGYLAFTVDQGDKAERYQGIVELKSGTLTESVQNYFRQSEQITTGLTLAIGYTGGHWRAGGILVQTMPGEGGHQGPPLASTDEDDWRRTMILMQSCTDRELLDPAMDTQDLLFRLFHEESVRVYEPLALHKGCRCSTERLTGILATMAGQDVADMIVDDAITMTCQFCSRDFRFDPESLQELNPELSVTK